MVDFTLYPSPPVFLRTPVFLRAQPAWWVAGSLVTVADLSTYANQPILFRGRNFKLTADTLYLRDVETLSEEAMQRALGQILKARINAMLPMLNDRFEAEPARISIKRMKTRWGSCRPDRRTLSINLHLVHLADELLEYVLVHEYAHFFARGHGRDFYQLMDQHCPDWKQRRKLLNAAVKG
ncbi:hypothetical protein HMPREF0044_1405 [Gleimia coleocanis DSM 15436]|uniref:YgjP-like metallopeptidase domain-containing protein n=1 Tax=Gleimia coleocanis DSM 15436 TaxID=525245 RepID=C0W1W5_9ACTO|nr:M48 family metallopeptidase [Gleimia coleocanis]EEH63481.1 hypothetical protein HMPREF0044_1405 [Gleimia coleocanis DSM 15436]